MVSYFIASFNEQCGRTPLLRAVLSGHADVACFLLESGSDVHEQANVSMVEQPYVFYAFMHVTLCMWSLVLARSWLQTLLHWY